jgi:hypothetical protein
MTGASKGLATTSSSPSAPAISVRSALPWPCSLTRFPGNGLLRPPAPGLDANVVSSGIFRWCLTADEHHQYRWGSATIHASGSTTPPPWSDYYRQHLDQHPFNMILLLPGLQSIPQSFYEAAAIDSARAAELPPSPCPDAAVILSVLLLGIITPSRFGVVYVMTDGGRSCHHLPSTSTRWSLASSASASSAAAICCCCSQRRHRRLPVVGS